MSEEMNRWCVLIPCSQSETWAVPQNCLAEIVTLQCGEECPPSEIEWRGTTVPVVDFGLEEGPDWCDPRRGAGLVAVFLGLAGEGCEYWGVAVRGDGLRATRLQPEEAADAPGKALPHATAAFEYRGVLCQVPDLDRLQRTITADRQVA